MKYHYVNRTDQRELTTASPSKGSESRLNSEAQDVDFELSRGAGSGGSGASGGHGGAAGG